MATIDGSAIRERPGHSAPNDRKSPLAVHFQDDADSVGMYHSQEVAFVDRISTLSKAFSQWRLNSRLMFRVQMVRCWKTLNLDCFILTLKFCSCMTLPCCIIEPVATTPFCKV